MPTAENKPCLNFRDLSDNKKILMAVKRNIKIDNPTKTWIRRLRVAVDNKFGKILINIKKININPEKIIDFLDPV